MTQFLTMTSLSFVNRFSWKSCSPWVAPRSRAPFKQYSKENSLLPFTSMVQVLSWFALPDVSSLLSQSLPAVFSGCPSPTSVRPFVRPPVSTRIRMRVKLNVRVDCKQPAYILHTRQQRLEGATSTIRKRDSWLATVAWPSFLPPSPLRAPTQQCVEAVSTIDIQVGSTHKMMVEIL